MLSDTTIWERYLHYLQRTLERRERTVASHRQVLWDFCLGQHAFIRPKPWHRATRRDLERYIDQPVRHGKRRGQRLGANTRLAYAAPVKMFYRVAAEQGWLGKDRMLGFHLPRGGRPVPRALEVADLRTALLAAEHDPRLYVFMWLGYGAGLRAGEIAKLRIEDCHLSERGYVHVVDGKGGKPRVIPMHPELRAALCRWLTGRPQAGPLFESLVNRGEPISYRTVSHVLSRHLHALGIDATGHALRHTWASRLLDEAGEEHLLTIARLGGWSSTKILEQVYGLGHLGRPAEVISRLPDPLDPKGVTR